MSVVIIYLDTDYYDYFSAAEIKTNIKARKTQLINHYQNNIIKH